MRQAALSILALLALSCAAGSEAIAGEQEVMQLLAQRSCPRCDLRRANLVFADLSGANLEGADLSGANLSQANLEGANLRRSNLRSTTLYGANLRGSTLQGAVLQGTDFREADLLGTLITQGELTSSHLGGAINLPIGSRSAEELHNEGVSRFSAQEYTEAERLFSEAIYNKPDQVESWIARGMTRLKTAKERDGKNDLIHAANLVEAHGNNHEANRIRKHVSALNKQEIAENKPNRGGQMLGAAAAAVKMIAPLAMKVFGYGAF